MDVKNTKICTKCEIDKNINEFGKRKAMRDGHRSACKVCERKDTDVYRLANIDKIHEREKQYRKANKKKISIIGKKYRKVNREKIIKWHRKYFRDNREKELERSREYNHKNNELRCEKYKIYYDANRDKIIDRHKLYNRANPEIPRRYQQQRRARKLALSWNLTKLEWEETLEHFNYVCARCGCNKFQMDHWIPLTYNGDDNPGTVAFNMVPLCKHCNCTKHSKMPEIYYKDEPEFYNMITEYLESRRPLDVV